MANMVSAAVVAPGTNATGTGNAPMWSGSGTNHLVLNKLIVKVAVKNSSIQDSFGSHSADGFPPAYTVPLTN